MKRLLHLLISRLVHQPGLLRLLAATLQRLPPLEGLAASRMGLATRARSVAEIFLRDSSFSNTSHAPNLVAGPFAIGLESGPRHDAERAELVAMLRACIDQLRTLAGRAAPLVPQVVQRQRERFLARWHEALEAAGAAATVPAAALQERALNEAAAFAIRIDVAEELSRLAAHLDEIERLLAGGGELGKRLDFLIQELHREANTLGSKSAALELTAISVEMKVLVEQMREQVQNIE